MITTNQVFVALRTQFNETPVILRTPTISGLIDGVAEIGTTLTALLNGEPATGSVIWLLDGQEITGETSAMLAVPSVDGSQISVEIDGQTSQSFPIRYATPMVAGSLPDQSLIQSSSIVQLTGASVFSFGGVLGFALMGAPASVSVDEASGIISIDTDIAQLQTGTAITVRAFDASAPERFAETGFVLNVTTAPDFTALVLTAPQAAANGINAATGSVTTDEAGGTLYAVLSTSTSAPSAANIAGGQDHTGATAAWSGSQAVPSIGIQTLAPAPSGLTADTTYTLHLMQEDAGENRSDVVSAASFTTDAIQSQPEAFTAGQWTISNATTGGDATLTLLALPDSGNNPIQIVQYRQNETGAWQPISGSNSTGVYALNDAFTDGVPTDVQIRAVNQNGPGPASDIKQVTTTDSADMSAPTLSLASYVDATNMLDLSLGEDSGAASIAWAIADPATDPVFDGTSWSGAAYETGTLTGLMMGANPFTIPLTSATPNGTREVSLYAYDAAGNISNVLRQAFTADRSAPAFVSAETSTDGTAIAITFDEALSGSTDPAFWTVTVGGTARAVSSVGIDGAVVTLTLSSAVANGDTVTFEYAAGDLADTRGNAVASFSALPVTNTVPSGGFATASDIWTQGSISASEVSSSMAVGTASAGRKVLFLVGMEGGTGKSPNFDFTVNSTSYEGGTEELSSNFANGASAIAFDVPLPTGGTATVGLTHGTSGSSIANTVIAVPHTGTVTGHATDYKIGTNLTATLNTAAGGTLHILLFGRDESFDNGTITINDPSGATLETTIVSAGDILNGAHPENANSGHAYVKLENTQAGTTTIDLSTTASSPSRWNMIAVALDN
ncbi:MAG: SwmB domain-containing protein [Pseudomonadota bacterium]